jgi:hypothetical protein
MAQARIRVVGGVHREGKTHIYGRCKSESSGKTYTESDYEREKLEGSRNGIAYGSIAAKTGTLLAAQFACWKLDNHILCREEMRVFVEAKVKCIVLGAFIYK